MKVILNKLKALTWFLYKEETLFEGKGLYSTVQVKKRGTQIELYTGENKYLQTRVNPSIDPYGIHWDWYLLAPWMKGDFSNSIDSLLILGLGGGAQVKSYNYVYSVNQITAVEIDPLIIDLGKRFFGLNDANLTTINEDAFLFFDTTQARYDVIIIDSFKEDMFENNCQSPTYFNKINEHLAPDGVLLINKLVIDESNNKMGENLKKVYNTVITFQIKYTVFYAATNSQTAPQSVEQVMGILDQAQHINSKLYFLTHIKPTAIRLI